MKLFRIILIVEAQNYFQKNQFNSCLNMVNNQNQILVFPVKKRELQARNYRNMRSRRFSARVATRLTQIQIHEQQNLREKYNHTIPYTDKHALVLLLTIVFKERGQTIVTQCFQYRWHYLCIQQSRPHFVIEYQFK